MDKSLITIIVPIAALWAVYVYAGWQDRQVRSRKHDRKIWRL